VNGDQVQVYAKREWEFFAWLIRYLSWLIADGPRMQTLPQGREARRRQGIVYHGVRGAGLEQDIADF
jgi:hypothetical protein